MADSSSVYATYNPLQGSVVDLLSQQEASDNAIKKAGLDRADEQARLKQQKAIADQAQKDKDAEDIYSRFKAGIGNTEPIKARSIDDVGINLVNQWADDFYATKVEYAEKAKNGTLTAQDRIKYETKLNKLMTKPKEFNTALSAFGSKVSEYDALNKEGKIHPNSDFENFRNNNDGYIPIYDKESGETYIAYKNTDGSQKDVNNDGKIDKLDLLPLSSLVNGTDKFQWDVKFDRDAELKQDIADIGYKTTQRDDGTNETTLVTYNPSAIAKKVQSKFYSPTGDLTPFAKSLAIERKVPLNDTKKIKELEVEYRMDIMTALKPQDKQRRKYDNLAVQKYKDTQEQFNTVQKDTATLGDDFIPDNNISREGLLENGYNLKKGIKIPQIGGEKGLQNAIIKNVFIDKKGNVIITGTADSKYTQTITQEGYKDSYKEVKKNGKFTRAASGQTLAEIARARGLANEDELRSELYRLNNYNPSEPQVDEYGVPIK